MISSSSLEVQGSIPCDSAGAWKPNLAVGISHGSHSATQGTLKSMFSRKGVIEKARGFDSPQPPVICFLLCTLRVKQRTHSTVIAKFSRLKFLISILDPLSKHLGVPLGLTAGNAPASILVTLRLLQK